MYNLNQLWTFMRVAELGSFHKVSQEAYMSPNAIMKQINNLEDELGGVKLFERTRAGNELTEIGRSLYEDAEFILRYCVSSQERLMNMAKEDSYTLRIWVSYACPVPLFQDLWDKINDRHPEIRLLIESSDNRYDTIKKLRFMLGKSVDIVFSFGNTDHFGIDKYNYIELSKVPLTALISRNHPLAAKDILTAEDFKGATLYSPLDGIADSVTAFCNHLEEKYPETNIIYKAYYDAQIYNTCANGNEIMLSPFDLMPVHPFLKAIPIDWPGLCSFGILYSATPSRAVEYFISAVESILEEEREK